MVDEESQKGRRAWWMRKVRRGVIDREEIFATFYFPSCSNCFPLAEITVTFTTPDMSVNEDVGSTDVCFIADIPSARSYEVQLGREASGTNPATRKLQDGMR